ncbi:hypothetical protein H2200_013309 [Cladophialophora chaetospira]|uniref:Pisatin demethylase n=1 Tax=Cladophialophora chaetospira TaxID=386627 RepID=A0AA38WW19_9EURO|nr:hypothetical protein H2200_013309 [Cladophialophora chaetospira]
MLFDNPLAVWILPAFGLVALLGRLVHNKYGYGISSVPGPFWAAYTDLWRFSVVWGGRAERVHIQLHNKYGPLVRLGPNCVSISDPEAIKMIYGITSTFVKSDFYPVQQQAVSRDGHLLQGMFNTTDEKYHAKLRRAVINAYAMSTLVQFEPFVDSTTVAFLNQLKRRFSDQPEHVCDFGQWLQFYAFDVIGELTFSKRLGFVDRGVDVDDIISNLEKALAYFAVVGQIPLLDKLLMKNPIRMWMSKKGLLNATSPVAIFAKKRMTDRLNVAGGQDEKGARDDQSSRRDFLSRFLEAGEKDPAFMTPERVLSLTSANVFAGSDTTAISLRAIFYYLLKNPKTLQKLQDELAEAEKEGLFIRDDKLVEWTEANKLLYLGAVIKEALRIHPAAGLVLERIVPAEGASLCGAYFPAGTIVGCSAWTIHRSRKVFGDDVDSFRPERWLEDDEKASEMNRYLFSFGGGARTCAGKNISYLEMYKLVPAVLRTFDLELAEPEKEWHTENKWFVKQSDLHVRLRTKSVKARSK